MKRISPGSPLFPRMALLVPVLLAASLFPGCGQDPAHPWPETTALPPLSSADLLAPGPLPVSTLQLSLEDPRRPTPPNGHYPGSPVRNLTTHIWFPSLPVPGSPAVAPTSPHAIPSASFPLVVYCHGYMSFGSEAKYTAEHLAGRGYIVVCPDFPLTWMFSPGKPNVVDVVNQPEDVTFLIDTFFSFNRDPGSPFYSRIDETRVAVMGLSLGGMTALLSTFHPALRDPRIRAAAVLAGPGSMFTERFYSHSDVPLLLIYGDTDAIVDYKTNALYALERAGPRATLVTLHGGTHTAFADVIAVFMDWMDNPDLLGCAALQSGLSLDVDFPALLGGEEAGLVQSDTPYPCTVTPLPHSMRPSRQQEITRLAVLSFLESRFSLDARHRFRTAEFLRETLQIENSDASVR
jgi:predicted dienelactone hydrolase